jgi:hypothetical protein
MITAVDTIAGVAGADGAVEATTKGTDGVGTEREAGLHRIQMRRRNCQVGSGCSVKYFILVVLKMIIILWRFQGT